MHRHRDIINAFAEGDTLSSPATPLHGRRTANLLGNNVGTPRHIISPVNDSDRRVQDMVPPIKRVGGEQIISHPFLAPVIEDATVIVLEKADAR